MLRADHRLLDGVDATLFRHEFGVTIDAPGYNIFVLGEPGSGRMSIVRQALEARARTLPAPDDWCYVANFADARRPRALRVPREFSALPGIEAAVDLVAERAHLFVQALQLFVGFRILPGDGVQLVNLFLDALQIGTRS